MAPIDGSSFPGHLFCYEVPVVIALLFSCPQPKEGNRCDGSNYLKLSISNFLKNLNSLVQQEGRCRGSGPKVFCKKGGKFTGKHLC